MSTRPGVWWLKSLADPRWNAGGDAENLVFGGDESLPPEARSVYKAKQEEYGEPPLDLEFGGMKD